jgi:hypothetical protein
VLHVYTAQAQDDSVLVEGTEQGSQPSDPSVPHGETQCSFCKIAGPVAVPSSAPVITAEVAAADELFVLTSSSRAPPLFVSPHPRGPPFA